MNLNIIIDYLILSIIASFAINMILRNIAKSNKILVDIPDKSRKFHKRATPLTGGISIIIAALILQIREKCTRFRQMSESSYQVCRTGGSLVRSS